MGLEAARPTRVEAEAELGDHVRAIAGPEAKPHAEQVAAVVATTIDRQRTLLVARTGFGKSVVYFSITKILRSRGWGPTIVVSPLLALMRDQVAAAALLGLVAETINSSNLEDWERVEKGIAAGEIDLLLISPERLANPGFRSRVFEMLLNRPMTLVCDEAHCISDWGHDFRPDYLRLRRILDELPEWTPVLATTATANQRVIDDVAGQMGRETVVLRTSLDRESLHLSVVDVPDDAARLAWLVPTFADLDGSGIVYALTVRQADTTARWLQSQGVDAHAYSGSTDAEDRRRLETDLKANRIKALVATSALGMGFDKADLAFCVHLGLPPTPVAYYQQIGRAGRAIDRAEVIALPGRSDQAVWNWFESVSLPPEEICTDVLRHLSADRDTSLSAIELAVNLGRTRLTTLMKILEVGGAVTRSGNSWRLDDTNWRYDRDKAQKLRQVRRDEAEQMAEYQTLESCRLRFLREALDDPEAADCGRCDRCLSSRWDRKPDSDLVDAARSFIDATDIQTAPRKQWPAGLDSPARGRIPPDRQMQPGRALCRLHDSHWSPLLSSVGDGDSPEVPADVTKAVAAVLKRWDWVQRPTWICPVPSRRHQELITAVATEIGRAGKLPVVMALQMSSGGGYQSDQANSAHQVTNVLGHLDVTPGVEIGGGPVLLIDDLVQSRWTMTVAAWVLTGAGSGPVLPFALCHA